MDRQSKVQQKAVFMVGDVHGCFQTLKQLLKKAKCDPLSHRLILLGDLIHKGPHSFKVLSWVRKNKVTALLGNHELKFIHALQEGQSVSKTFDQLKKDMGADLLDWISYIKSWPIYIEEEDFIAVHGGLVPGKSLSESKTEQLLNIRYWNAEKNCISNDSSYPAWHDLYKGSKLVVYAHWARQGLKIKQNSIGLDTGCVYGGKLTGLWLNQTGFLQGVTGGVSPHYKENVKQESLHKMSVLKRKIVQVPCSPSEVAPVSSRT